MQDIETEVLNVFRKAVQDKEFYSKIINDNLYLYKLFMCEAGRISLEKIRDETYVL